jgi:hypothetical protein
VAGIAVKRVSDETKALLKSIIDHCDDDDRATRDRQIRVWRRLKLLWENIQHTYYSEVAHDWRIPELERTGEDSDQGYYDKPVNIFRAYLESIIAALSVTVPAITCYPDDADNSLDVITAKTGDRVAALIGKHNNVNLLWLHALFIFCTEGMTTCYAYPDEDESYGTYEDKKYEDVQQTTQQTICSNCHTQLADEEIIDDQKDKFMPGDEDASIDAKIATTDDFELCPYCSQVMIPEKQQQTATITRLVGVTQKPKSRICMEVYGGLFVKTPIWARSVKECMYLIYSYETHYANAIEEFGEDLDNEIQRGSQSSYDMYEQWGRTSPQYRGEQPVNNVTIRTAWLRPTSFNILNKEQSAALHKEFPDGVKVCVVDDQVANACNERMDDCWTILVNPLSDYVHFDPLGLLLTSVQDITNDLVSLVVQTVEHGIPQTFADPKVLNFNAYRNSEVIPGGIYPATPKSGRPLNEGFYEVKTATLSQEVLPFAQKIQEIGQLVSGALPSLFGGQMSGSRTASEYSMSRAQALQRLQTTWKMFLSWWKEVNGKVIPMYIKMMKEDEKQVQKDEFGNFINIFIRRADLEGKIGSIELEANENLPITWNQQKDAIMELFKMQNDMMTAALTDIENLPYIKRAIGLSDFIIPGEDERQKEYEEILQLVASEPIEVPPDMNQYQMAVQQAQMQGMPPPPPPQPQTVPSVEPDFELDNHKIAADIDRRWLIGDAGRVCKTDNPAGYQNVLLHMKMHQQMQQAQMMQQQAQMMQQAPPPQQPPMKPPASTGKPLGMDQNEPTIQ